MVLIPPLELLEVPDELPDELPDDEVGVADPDELDAALPEPEPETVEEAPPFDAPPVPPTIPLPEELLITVTVPDELDELPGLLVAVLLPVLEEPLVLSLLDRADELLEVPLLVPLWVLELVPPVEAEEPPAEELLAELELA
jgi:hypothetical protein